MDKYTVANIVNDNINKVLSALNNESYVDNGVYEVIRGLRIKHIYEGKYEEGITFENGYTVKESIIPLAKRGVENDHYNK